jgi:hypothetical protein
MSNMRLLIASMAAMAAFAVAAPAFAQEENAPPAAPAADPVPATKPKPGTAAYCQGLKSASSRSSCLKKVSSAKPAKPKGTATASKKTHKPAATPAAAKQPDVGQLTPPAAAPAATAAAPATGSVAVPPLPQKTI